VAGWRHGIAWPLNLDEANLAVPPQSQIALSGTQVVESFGEQTGDFGKACRAEPFERARDVVQLHAGIAACPDPPTKLPLE
jgi:hypothetical protein